MTILSRLTEKSWESPGHADRPDPLSYRPSAGAVGLATYFAVAAVMFSLLTAAYLMRMGLHADHGGADWLAMPDPPLLWINSAILFVSSLAWERARRAALTAMQDIAVRASIAGAALGILFIGGQWLLWRHYQAGGYYLSANPSYAFFYLLTSLHGLHIAGGLVAAGRALFANNLRNIALCAVYWHFLLIIWVLLVVLLLTT